MIAERISTLLNQQLNKKFHSAYLYLSMDAYFRQNGLYGLANWFQVQAKEEIDYAMILFDYIGDYEGTIKLTSINAPDINFKNPIEVTKVALIHESRATESTNNIKNIAIEENDQPTSLFMDWYIKEQFDKEYNIRIINDKLKFCADSRIALMLLDKELLQREYSKITYSFIK